MKQLLLSLFLLSCYGASTGQTTPGSDQLCGKKWYCTKYKEADGKFHPAPAEEVNNYTLYNCDGTFISVEMKAMIKGKWIFDQKKNTLTATQNQTKDYPAKIVCNIVQADAQHLVVKAKDAGGQYLTLYMETRE